MVSLSESIKSRKLSDPCHVSSTVEVIISILQTLSDYVDEIPPAPQSSRYGNVAYRTWHERMSSDAESFMLKFLPPDLHGATVELVPYFTDSFGNSSRIDYGAYIFSFIIFYFIFSVYVAIWIFMLHKRFASGM